MNMFYKNYITFATDSEEVVDNVEDAITAIAAGLDKECVGYETRRSFNETKSGSFSRALAALKAGKGARLPGWKPDVVIRACFPVEGEGCLMTAPYLYVESRFGRVPWRETFIELFSEEWEIVD